MFRVLSIAAVLIAFAVQTGHAASVGVRIGIQMPARSILYCRNMIRIARAAGKPTHNLSQCDGFEDYVRAVGADRTASAGATTVRRSTTTASITSNRLTMANAERRIINGLPIVESVQP